MSVRVRNTSTSAWNGGDNRFGSYSNYGYQNDYAKTTTDEIGIGDNAQFLSSYKKNSGGILYRPYTDWANVQWDSLKADSYRFIGLSWGHLGLSGVTPDSDLAVQAAARTTPSRPYVDVPVELAQLGDLLSLLKNKGQSIIHQAASWNLEYQFNIRPVVEDLVKIFNFQDQVERRIKELERLRGPRGLRRTIPIGDLATYESSDSIIGYVVHTRDAYLQTNMYRRTRLLIGAHVRWKPTMDLTKLAPGELRVLARKAVLGLTFDGSSAWQLIPWSWLINWGISIGDWFKANRNIIPAELDSLTLLKHTRSEYTGDAQGGPNLGGFGAAWSLSPWQYLVEDKQRIRVTPIPVAHFPFLSGNQMGILGSLAITGKSTR